MRVVTCSDPVPDVDATPGNSCCAVVCVEVQQEWEMGCSGLCSLREIRLARCLGGVIDRDAQ